MKAMYALAGSRVESRSLSSARVKLAPPHLALGCVELRPNRLALRLRLRVVGVQIDPSETITVERDVLSTG